MDGSGSVERQLVQGPETSASTLDHGVSWSLQMGGVLNVHGDLSEQDGQRIRRHSRISKVQFSVDIPVSGATWRVLDAVFRDHPEADLRWGAASRFADITFLGSLPSLRGLTVEGRQVDLSPVRDHAGIVRLGVVDGVVSLRPLAGVGSIRSLWLGKGARHCEVTGELPNLEQMTITGVTATDLSYLEPLENLRSLAFWLGGARRFVDLPRMRNLQRVDIWRARQLEPVDLAPLNDVTGLKTLALRELPKLTSLSWLTNYSVRNLELDLSNLNDFTSLAGMPSLENLAVRRPVPKDVLTQLVRLPALQVVYLHEPTLDRLVDCQGGASEAIELRPIDFPEGEFMHDHPISGTA
jgi:hypothetical protein